MIGSGEIEWPLDRDQHCVRYGVPVMDRTGEIIERLDRAIGLLGLIMDSLTPSHDAQEAKNTPWPSSEVNWVSMDDPHTPPPVVVDAPHNHPKQPND